MGQPSRRTALVPAALILLTATGGGCSSPGNYFRSRALDLWDIVPVSVKGGYGAGASVRATEFFQTGLAMYEAKSFGLARGRWGAVWKEDGYDAVLLNGEQYTLEPPGRWPGGPGWTVDPWLRRSSGNALFFIPMQPPHMAENPLPPWPAWLDLEANVFLGVAGARVGLGPGELIDFLAGIVGLDPLGDDVDGRREREMQEKPPEPEPSPPFEVTAPRTAAAVAP